MKHDGFSSIIIFILFTGLFSVLGLTFYNVQQSYVVACKRCQYYQVRYELEGLLYYGMRQVIHNKKKRKKQDNPEQDHSAQTKTEIAKKLPEWCTIGNTVYTGFIQADAVKKEMYAVFVELRSLETSYKVNCSVVCDVDSYEIIDFTIA